MTDDTPPGGDPTRRIDGEPSIPEPPERQRTPFLVLQFFVFPLSIVAVCVAVFVVFGLIASESKGAREYLQEVRTGGSNRRWQAAFELSKVLQAGKDPALKDPRLVEEAIVVFVESKDDDPRVRRYLALALGRLRDRRAVRPLLDAVEQLRKGDARTLDSETLIYAVWALGSIGDAAALPELLACAAHPDRGVRKVAVHALSVFDTPEARAALRQALADPVEDVRWNAALGLGRRGEAASVPVLLAMLDRGQLDKVRVAPFDPETAPGAESLTNEQQDAILLEAVRVAPALHDAALRAALERLRDGDRSPSVRDAARQALETPETTPR